MRFVRRAYLCIWLIAVLAWITSYYAHANTYLTRVMRETDRTVGHRWDLHSNWGELCVRWSTTTYTGDHSNARPPGSSWSWLASVVEIGGKSFIDYKQPHRAGFQYGIQNSLEPTLVDRTRWLILPHWSVVPLLTVLPALWAVRSILRRRRARAGRCATCGYNLRATPGRCPECGDVPATAAA